MVVHYKIGSIYIYPNDTEKKQFKLSKVKGGIYLFECGHWCTDSVFEDLINIETGKQNFVLIPNFFQQKLKL